MSFDLVKYAKKLTAKSNNKKECWAYTQLFRNFLLDLKKSTKPGSRYKWVFKAEIPQKRIAFIEKHFKHPNTGEAFMLYDWQKAYFTMLWGWVDRQDDRKPRYRRAFIQLAKKNGKTTTLAIQAIMHLLEPARNNLCASFASKYEQGAILMEQARKLIEVSPILQAIIKYKHKQLIYPDKNSKYKVLTGNPDKEEGDLFSLAIGDEYHVYKDSRMINMLNQSMVNRDDGRLILITTAGLEVPCPAYDYYQQAQVALRFPNRNNDRSLYIIFELDKEDDPENPAIWYKSNPTLAQRGLIQNLIDQKNDMESNVIDKETFKAKSLNMWGVGGSIEFLNINQWERKNTKHKENYTTFTDWIHKNAPHVFAYIGIDFSQNEDLTALAIIYHNPQTGEMILRVQHFTCQMKFETSQQTKKPDYTPYVKSEELLIVGETIINKASVIEYITAIQELQKVVVRKVVVDDYGGSSIMPLVMKRIGADKVHSASRKHYNSLVRAQDLVLDNSDFYHDTNALMEWQICNVLVARDTWNKPHLSKKSANRKIDGVLATIYAVDAMDRDNVAMATDRDVSAEEKYKNLEGMDATIQHVSAPPSERINIYNND